MRTTLSITPEDTSKRLDIIAAEKTGMTRSRIQNLIKQKQVLVNGYPQTANYRIRKEDCIDVGYEEQYSPALVPEDLPLTVLHEDGSLVVVDKPAGMVVYPGAGHASGTLMNAVLYRCGKVATIGSPLRPGVVHRLDKDTSGVMVVALDDYTYYDLVEQLRKRSVYRLYHALVAGEPGKDSGEVSLQIGRSVSDRKKMSTRTPRGKEAVTTWRVLRRFGIASLIEARLGTGRTHQIRVHFAAIGHPVLGDRTYGRKTQIDAGKTKISFPRQMLHAATLGFIHPGDKSYREFRSPLPKDMQDCIEQLESLNENMK